MDDKDYEEIKEDIRNECAKYGEVLSVMIPRPSKAGEPTPGVSKVFVKFAHDLGAKQARYRLSGRNYNRRTVVTSYYPEHYFDKGDYSLI